MNILLTGGTGFIGTHVKNYYIRSGHTVSLLDHEEIPTSIFTKNSFDVLIHLAGYGNHSHQKDGQEMIKANITKLYQLLQRTKHIDYKAFVNISTSSVYGPSFSPMFEDQRMRPQTMYSVTKAAGEMVVNQFFLETNKPVVNVRPFSIYGPGEADFRFIPTVIRKALVGETVEVWEGNHDWTYIADFVQGMDTVIRNIEHLKGAVINVGSGTSYSNEEVVKELSKILPFKYELVDKKRPHDSEKWVADIDRLRSYGYVPVYSLPQGLDQTYRYYYEKYSKTENT